MPMFVEREVNATCSYAFRVVARRITASSASAKISLSVGEDEVGDEAPAFAVVLRHRR